MFFNGKPYFSSQMNVFTERIHEQEVPLYFISRCLAMSVPRIIFYCGGLLTATISQQFAKSRVHFRMCFDLVSTFGCPCTDINHSEARAHPPHRPRVSPTSPIGLNLGMSDKERSMYISFVSSHSCIIPSLCSLDRC